MGSDMKKVLSLLPSKVHRAPKTRNLRDNNESMEYELKFINYYYTEIKSFSFKQDLMIIQGNPKLSST